MANTALTMLWRRLCQVFQPKYHPMQPPMPRSVNSVGSYSLRMWSCADAQDATANVAVAIPQVHETHQIQGSWYQSTRKIAWSRWILTSTRSLNGRPGGSRADCTKHSCWFTVKYMQSCDTWFTWCTAFACDYYRPPTSRILPQN